VLDVATGEVIAMVSLPTFNPNRVGMAGSEQLRNITTQSVFELGSTFKPITMATAMENGVVTSMARRFDATHRSRSAAIPSMTRRAIRNAG
jgi:cell division protein FtsI (penicillin-binding protein 3)